MSASVRVEYIGRARTPYGGKFAVPRQPGLAPDAVSVIEFFPPYSAPEAFRGLEGFSHIYVLFVFDRIPRAPFHATVRPPRLGGNAARGVFASRSPYRPSRLGLSVVRLMGIEPGGEGVSLRVGGADLVDGTPIVDIKPYVPFADSVPGASGGFAPGPPPSLPVRFRASALDKLRDLGPARLRAIEQSLAQDPRPAYRDDGDEKSYFALIYNRDIEFRARGGIIEVIDAVRKGEPSC